MDFQVQPKMKDVLINFPQLDCCKNLADKLKQNNLNCKLDSYNVQDDVVFEKLKKSICIGNEYKLYSLNSMINVVADVISCLTFPYHLKKLRSIIITWFLVFVVNFRQSV